MAKETHAFEIFDAGPVLPPHGVQQPPNVSRSVALGKEIVH